MPSRMHMEEEEEKRKKARPSTLCIDGKAMAAWVCNTTHYYENVLWQELDGGRMIGITI